MRPPPFFLVHIPSQLNVGAEANLEHLQVFVVSQIIDFVLALIVDTPCSCFAWQADFHFNRQA